MIRTTGLLLLAAVLLAGDVLDPTPLRWTAGRTTLAEAVARLEAGGNRAWLADGIDDRAEAELPAVDGPWWTGVQAICDAFALRPDEGEPADERLDGQGLPIPVGHGTVVLSPGRPPAMQIDGGLLVALDTAQDLRLWLRAEPRIGRGALAWGRIDAATVAGGLLEPHDAGNDAGDRASTRWQAPDQLPADARFSAVIQVAALARWQASLTLTANSEAHTEDAPQRIDAMLATGPECTSWLGMPLPERRPLLAVAIPGSIAQNLALRLRGPDGDLAMRNGGGGAAEDGRQIVLRYPRNLPDAAVELRLEGRSTQTGRRIDVDLAVPAPQLSPPALPLEAPALVRWNAGTAPLGHWLHQLSASGNPVLVEVGVDTDAQVSVPACSGRFWDAILILCRASGLAPVPGDTGMICGGAVRLVRRPLPPAAVCGPFLLLGSVTATQPGNIAVELRCLVEPRLQPESFGPPGVTWATWAEDQTGGVHPIAASDAPDVRVQRRGRNGDEDIQPLRIRVGLARPDPGELAIDGLLTVPRLRVWRAAVEATPGQPTEFQLGGRAVELTAHPAPVAMNGSPWGPGLLLRGLAGANGVQFAVHGGDIPEQAGEANRSGGSGAVRPWLAWCRIPAEGGITVTLAARASQPPLVTPFRLRFTPPEGL